MCCHASADPFRACLVLLQTGSIIYLMMLVRIIRSAGTRLWSSVRPASACIKRNLTGPSTISINMHFHTVREETSAGTQDVDDSLASSITLRLNQLIQ